MTTIPLDVTDGQTDGQTTWLGNGNTALRHASRGKMPNSTYLASGNASWQPTDSVRAIPGFTWYCLFTVILYTVCCFIVALVFKLSFELKWNSLETVLRICSYFT